MRRTFQWRQVLVVLTVVGLALAGGRLALTWLFVTHVATTPWLVVGFNLAVTLTAAALVALLGVARAWLRRRRRIRAARLDRL